MPRSVNAVASRERRKKLMIHYLFLIKKLDQV
jgi:hypothetical protein